MTNLKCWNFCLLWRLNKSKPMASLSPKGPRPCSHELEIYWNYFLILYFSLSRVDVPLSILVITTESASNGANIPFITFYYSWWNFFIASKNCSTELWLNIEQFLVSLPHPFICDFANSWIGKRGWGRRKRRQKRALQRNWHDQSSHTEFSSSRRASKRCKLPQPHVGHSWAFAFFTSVTDNECLGDFN